MSQQYEFSCYYYALVIEGLMEREKYISEVRKCIGNKEGYSIEEIVKEEKYLIKLAHGYDANILPKRGNKKTVDVTEFKPLDLEDDEGLFFDVYILVSFKKEDCDPIAGCFGIISVLKGGKQISGLVLDAFFKNLLKINEQVFSARPIIYKSKEEYVQKSISRLNRVSFKVAGANMQRQLGLDADDGMTQLWKVREQLGGDDFTLSFSSRNGLNKGKTTELIEKYSHLFKKGSVSVDVIDNMGNRLQQQLDEIRFKATISLSIEEKDLNYEEVKVRMQDNYTLMIEKIREEYTPTK